MKPKKGVLLVNLGTPDSPRKRDVFRYLNEFLTDSRVIDLPWWKRQLLVRGLIVPTRLSNSAKCYRSIWTKEGSPLLVHTKNTQNRLSEKLGLDYHVEIGMRYQKPSIESALVKLKKCTEITVVPLFPQYASATTGSVHQKVMEIIKLWPIIPKMSFINSFHDHPLFIQAFVERAKPYLLKNYDKILFSFHGLPVHHLTKSDLSGRCQKDNRCCEKQHHFCYAAQCYETGHNIAQNLNLSATDYQISFQSRLGKDPWLEPYTSDILKDFARNGLKKVLVICPAFVCDCLETIYEIGIEYDDEFRHNGGDKLDLVEGLNDHPTWINTLASLVRA